MPKAIKDKVLVGGFVADKELPSKTLALYQFVPKRLITSLKDPINSIFGSSGLGIELPFSLYQCAKEHEKSHHRKVTHG